MLLFVVKRTLRFIPILFAIAILGFLLTAYMPGDPVKKNLIARYGADYKNSVLDSKQLQSNIYKELGLDKPLFYFSINSYNACDTLFKIQDYDQRKAMERLCYMYGCWENIQTYFNTINTYIANNSTEKKALINLRKEYENKRILLLLSRISSRNNRQGINLEKLYANIVSSKSLTGNYIPTLNLNGYENQFNLWLFGNGQQRKGIIRGDFGYSLRTGEPIGQFIWKKLGYSLELILIAVSLAFLFAIPTGMRLTRIKSKYSQNVLNILIYLMYSIPGYLVATLLIFFFANTQTLYWFPESGLYPIGYHPSEHSYWANLRTGMPYMILPILTYAISAFAFISKLTKNITTDELNFDYYKTALAKGLSAKQATRKHVLKNILIPLVTLFTQILPVAVGGTLIVELIFQYPGIGQVTYDAALNANYPVIIAVFTISGLMTVAAYLLADIVYALINPKLRH